MNDIICPYCGHVMIFDYEEKLKEFNQYIKIYVCSNCEADAEFSSRTYEEE